MKLEFSSASKKILVIVGPTASGKTEAAHELSKHLSVEMISCDSMQVYKSMPITTQVPSKRVMRALRTHLVSFLDPSKEYNAALFRRDALTLIPKILKRKRTPMIVGGTGLYLRALLDGLFESEGAEPSRDEALRMRLLSEQEARGGSTLHEKLRAIDPSSAFKIHANDLRRIVRALEVFYLTGKPISEQKSNRKGARSEFDFRIFLLEGDRKVLYERIDRRVERMMKKGLVGEVKKLRRKKLSQTAEGAIGIREISQTLLGKSTLPEAVELLKKNTRNYAKRQLSWFRHEKGVESIFMKPEETAKETAIKILESWNKS